MKDNIQISKGIVALLDGKDEKEVINILINLLIKFYLTNFENQKESFMIFCSGRYDHLEEEGNLLKMIPSKNENKNA